jgi:N-acetylmuramic acid 6-phosphate etherase
MVMERMDTGPNTDAPRLDLLDTEAVVELLLCAEERVVPAVRASATTIAEGAVLLGDCIRDGGRVVLIGAGTSGRLAVCEAAELPGTFGLAPQRCVGIMAGGDHSLAGTDYDEDDVEAGARAVAAEGLSAGDVVVAVAASGRTPYAVAAAETARAAGATVIAVVAAAGSPLAALANVAIEVPTGEEVLRGSTRLTAGTAQKIVLNALTTSAMARAGRVHGDLMIDVVAANAKLRKRSVAIVAEIAGCPAEAAYEALTACAWNGRAAVLQLVAGLSPALATESAAAHHSLREALVALEG